MNRKNLKKINFLFKALIFGTCFTAGSTIAQTLPLTPNLINYNSEIGETLLIESKSKEDFFPLSMQFITQINQAYCGVASIVMVLNSLGIEAPEASQYKPFRVFTQENFFNNKATQQVVPAEVVSRQGMTLEQMGKLINSYGVQVKVYHASDTNIEEFRKLAVENLNQKENFVLVNYLRREIGQEKGGHISPIAAYNAENDRFLILDVSRYKYPPIWVKTADLWKAMNTKDSTSAKSRGFAFISR
jgi:Phytochelatin synthase